MIFSCEKCASERNVKLFHYLGRESGQGAERLCWECRWPYIEARVHPYPVPVEKEKPTSGGQASFDDYL